jgi:hypothetical protein
LCLGRPGCLEWTGEPELARDALWLSILTYGLFLELSEKAVGHKLGAQVLDMFRASDAYKERFPEDE